MKPNERNILIKKRYVELECLGIPAQLYYKAVQLIERHVYVVIKENKFLIFKKNDFDLHDGHDKSKSKYYDADKIVELLNETFGLGKTLAFTMYSEWLREKVIYCKMTENSTKYWDFLCLPMEYTDFEGKDNDYNF
jgi:hypothetical protein